MATLGDIGIAAAINLLTAIAFFIVFAILRLQPINDRVYFPKWYLKGVRSSPTHSGAFVQKFVNLDFRSYLKFLQWMPAALKMPEPELIDHAGLDSAVYLRIYLLGLKIFVPIAFLAFSVLVPVNWTNNTLEISDFEFSVIDKFSLSNVPKGSERFWTHLVMAYVFSFWTCYVLCKEYGTVATMRLHFLASKRRRPDQFTIINVYNQEYESGAAFWPDVHGRIITALVISQVLLLGLMSTKEAAQSTPFLIALPVLTIWFHRFCKYRYEPAFVKYPLQEAMKKDILEHIIEPNLDLKGYLLNAYVHPLFKDGEDDSNNFFNQEKEYENVLVPTKRQSHKNTPAPSKHEGSLSPSLPDAVQEHSHLLRSTS